MTYIELLMSKVKEKKMSHIEFKEYLIKFEMSQITLGAVALLGMDKELNQGVLMINVATEYSKSTPQSEFEHFSKIKKIVYNHSK